MNETPRIYFDSNVFIEAFEQDTARADHARWVLDAVERGAVRAVTSELTLSEVLVKPFQLAASDLAAAYEQMLTSDAEFDVLPVDRDVLVEAARIRAERPAIRLPDAIHIASARSSDCAMLVSGDGRMTTRAGPVVVPLGPYTVDDITVSR